ATASFHSGAAASGTTAGNFTDTSSFAGSAAAGFGSSSSGSGSSSFGFGSASAATSFGGSPKCRRQIPSPSNRYSHPPSDPSRHPTIFGFTTSTFGGSTFAGSTLGCVADFLKNPSGLSGNFAIAALARRTALSSRNKCLARPPTSGPYFFSS